MAGPLLMWVLLAGPGSGCLWPQDDTLFYEPPPQKNSPPRILLTQIKPAQDSSFLPKNPMTGQNCTLPFSFFVEDPDVADAIRVRWFVFAPGATRGNAIAGDKTISGGVSTLRPGSVTAPLGLHNTELAQNGDHRVEVEIADGFFDDTSPTGTEPKFRSMPDGGVLKDDAYIDSYLWIVKTSDTLQACAAPP